MMKKEKKQTTQSGDAKGKASFDQNGQGAAPKYGQAGDKPNESGEKADKRKNG
ncbi:MAG: hypothetical protein REI78_09750 [Pedobacter sp.]|nr:hypothetical protein [Pedobacter sp.]MDQ8053299.1 hypothetical protein [Pedobacter sp.]